MCRLKLTEQQKNCPYCHGGYFEGKSGWQNANVFFAINNDGTFETLVDGVYGYVRGLVECPFCKRPLNEEVDL